ncbi:MAG: hypothetical protein U9Q78_05990 [Chloroflexota bacterium]|nr:hypothetical protein [Chloroflexota bacterium]
MSVKVSSEQAILREAEAILQAGGAGRVLGFCPADRQPCGILYFTGLAEA